jgi:ABC-type branched-subunit amino acid transport system substrate-binding protein
MRPRCWRGAWRPPSTGPGSRTRRAARTAGPAALAILTACALFRPERVALRTTVVETLPADAAPGSPTPGGTPSFSGGGRTVFIPGSSTAAGSGRPNYASDEGVTAELIRIGTIQPMDGPAAQLGRPLYRATQAYVNALNARGGIAGRRVELFLQTACINCEDENKLAAKALVEQKRVFAVVNTYMNTYAFSAALSYLNERGVPLVQGWSGTGPEDLTWGNRQTPWNVFFTIRNADGVRIYARWLRAALERWAAAGRLPREQGCDRHPFWVATVGLRTSQDERRAEEFRRVWEGFGPGFRVRTHQSVEAEEETVTRMDSFIAAMKDADACGAFSASNITMVFGMQAARRQSWVVPWVAKSAWGKAATDTCGPSCDGGFTDNNGWGWPEIRTPQMRQYREAMDRYYPDATDDAQTLGGWIGMMAFEAAAARLGPDLTRRGLMDILTNLRGFDTGIGAPITTSPSDHVGMGQTMMLQICHNRFVRVSGWLDASSAPPASIESPCGWGYG